MIYYVVPELKLQPTWGGDYISNKKNLKISDSKIGQAYEFYSESKVIPAHLLKDTAASKYPYIVIDKDNKKDESALKKYKKDVKKLSKLKMKEIFGQKDIPNILIKFSQAKGTSFQIHTKEKTKKFLPKPEAWYFFNKGKVTLGLKPKIDIDEYKKTCKNIYKLTKTISKEVKKKDKSIEEARKELSQYIEMNNPLEYVNTVILEKEKIVDNTLGGIHHSWEEDEALIPFGNIIYEVQQDVSDEKSTIRAYDKGKLLDDGSHRKLQIDDYFENIKKGRKNNKPKTSIKAKIRLKEVKKWTLNKIFDTKYFQMDELLVKKDYDVEKLGFRHIFVRRGSGSLITEDEEIELQTGCSYILPHNTQEVRIKNAKKVDPKDRTNKNALVLLLTYKEFIDLEKK
ncbi:hypothetical protein GF362_06760 [Candidatus Dojkabacteria bacterium]|nr:hypothetical protein [Candidatus Dojkabacteria bacterium]